MLSQTAHGKAVKGETYEKLVHRIQFGGDEVVKAKDGAGSATLSMAYAGAKFTDALLRGLNGEKGVITPTFVKSPLYEDQGIEYFSSNVELGVSVVTNCCLYVWLISCIAERCREDPSRWSLVCGGGEAVGGLPAGAEEEHREGQSFRCSVIRALETSYPR